MSRKNPKVKDFSCYKQKEACTCVFSKNVEQLACGKCHCIPSHAYFTVCGFLLEDGICLCPTCHDKIDDCEE